MLNHQKKDTYNLNINENNSWVLNSWVPQMQNYFEHIANAYKANSQVFFTLFDPPQVYLIFPWIGTSILLCRRRLRILNKKISKPFVLISSVFKPRTLTQTKCENQQWNSHHPLFTFRYKMLQDVCNWTISATNANFKNLTTFLDECGTRTT